MLKGIGKMMQYTSVLSYRFMWKYMLRLIPNTLGQILCIWLTSECTRCKLPAIPLLAVLTLRYVGLLSTYLFDCC